MNKISKELAEYMNTLFNVCSLCDIDDVVIEKGMVRAQSADAKKGIYIMEYDNIPELAFDGLGIRDVKTLKARMSILDEDNINIAFEPKVKDNGDTIVRRVSLSNKKTKVDFTCFDPTHIKSPKRINDTDLYSFDLTSDTVKIMNRMKNVVAGVEDISFSSEKDGSIKYIVTADNGDMFDHTIADSYEKLDPTSTKNHFFFCYKIKYVAALFKAGMDLEGSAKITLSSRGIIKMKVKGFTIRIVPEVDHA